MAAQTLETFEQEAAAVHAGLQPDGVYCYMSAPTRTASESGRRLRELLLQHSGGLSAADKVELLNRQEQLDAPPLHNEREQRDRQALGGLQRQPRNQKQAGNQCQKRSGPRASARFALVSVLASISPSAPVRTA